MAALSKDKKTCLMTREVIRDLDENCAEMIELEEPICNACKNGFVFVDGKCGECKIEEG